MDLRTRLSSWDGKSVTHLTETAAAFGERQDYVTSLIVLAADDKAPFPDAATWLLKRSMEQGIRLCSEQVSALVATLPALKTWQAQLHICQIVRMLSVEPDDAETVAVWLQPLLQHERPFLRAWSLDALCALAERSPDLLPRADLALSTAGSDEAASVRARARRLAR